MRLCSIIGRLFSKTSVKYFEAIFFVTSHYIKYSPDTVKRMVDEGHIVANHTNHHYSMPSVTYSIDVFNKELTDVEDKFN